MIFQDYLSEAAVQYGLSLSSHQLNQFTLYYNLLVEWNEKVNLTAITEPKEVAVKHMIDSLSCCESEVFLPAAAVIDVGTGAGFPGLPLKIFRPDLKLTLMDSLQKRLTFLEAAVQSLGLEGVTIVHARAEEAARQKEYREKYDVVVSRAVARLNVLAEYCLPFAALGGYFVALKGAQYEMDMKEAEKAVFLLGGGSPRVRCLYLPGLEDKRAIIYIKKEHITASTYPRKAGTPEKKPL
ncbi:rrna small subunit methyltransferase g [Lucifera butyrica]|uniref:Ribosomal RNA small subunit methyltransferase G n=1 Tax=Lucifera butyrica TaxID=1351585 RepID=A0A498R473_9FIRM|nr:16S rRNA (guanine(527)-N(7))-methyltransferase RsmG [Lucifera butyrica]VBB07486.1 rrna small subunit methyltransferase g [Lucifera butyrica]